MIPIPGLETGQNHRISSSESMGPMHAVFINLDSLVPAGLAGPAIRSWLNAPIAGLPLFKRLFEPLVGKKIRKCIAQPSVVACELSVLTSLSPCFGMRLQLLEEPVIDRLSAFEFDASGLLNNDPIFSRDPRPLAVNSFDSLLKVSRMALEGDLLGRPVHGTLRGDLLCGTRSFIHENAQVLGVSAIGERSTIGENVILGPGAVIGRHCTVGSNVVLSDCLILDGGQVPCGARIADAVWIP